MKYTKAPLLTALSALFVLAIAPSSALAVDYDCSDFATQEAHQN